LLWQVVAQLNKRVFTQSRRIQFGDFSSIAMVRHNRRHQPTLFFFTEVVGNCINKAQREYLVTMRPGWATFQPPLKAMRCFAKVVQKSSPVETVPLPVGKQTRAQAVEIG
jgi:hypothetical protein